MTPPTIVSRHSLLPLSVPPENPPQSAEIPPASPAPVLREPAPRKHRKAWIGTGIAIAALAIWAISAAVRSRVRSQTAASMETVAARQEDFASALRLSGTVEAVQSRPIITPQLAGSQMTSMILTWLIPAGTHVKKGDKLAEFDRQAQIKDYLDKKASYEDLANQVIEKQAAEEAATATDQTALQQAKDDLAKARLEVSKNDILSRIDAEKNTETLQEDEATLVQLQETFKLKREAAAAGIHTLEIQRERARATMNYAQQNSQNMVLRAPMDGVAVLNITYVAGRGLDEPQAGDQLWPGVAFMKVVEPSAMVVSALVNQEDVPNLHVGQHARVHLDAYPNLSFPGTLEELSPLGQGAGVINTVRTFVATFSIEGTSPKLMPDLTAFVDAQLANVKDATVVPIQSTVRDRGQEYVWIKSGLGFERHAVQIGPESDLDAVITSGLRPGDVVLENAPEGAGTVSTAQTAQASLQ